MILTLVFALLSFHPLLHPLAMQPQYIAILYVHIIILGDCIIGYYTQTGNNHTFIYASQLINDLLSSIKATEKIWGIIINTTIKSSHEQGNGKLTAALWTIKSAMCQRGSYGHGMK